MSVCMHVCMYVCLYNCLSACFYVYVRAQWKLPSWKLWYLVTYSIYSLTFQQRKTNIDLTVYSLVFVCLVSSFWLVRRRFWWISRTWTTSLCTRRPIKPEQPSPSIRTSRAKWPRLVGRLQKRGSERQSQRESARERHTHIQIISIRGMCVCNECCGDDVMW